jgi:hypothetical protein
MSEQTVNETTGNQNVNRFPKLSKNEKIILQWLSMDHGSLDLHDRTSGAIAFGFLEIKHGVVPYDKEMSWEELPRGKWRFIKPWNNLPHFIAQIRKGGNPEDLEIHDIYEKVHYTHVIKRDLLKEASKIRASVCRSLKRLLDRGLIIQLNVTNCTNFMGKRIHSEEKTYYFISKEQAQKTLACKKICTYEGQFKVKEVSR